MDDLAIGMTLIKLALGVPIFLFLWTSLYLAVRFGVSAGMQDFEKQRRRLDGAQGRQPVARATAVDPARRAGG